MEGIFEMLSFLKDTECFANLQNEHFETLATRYMVIKNLSHYVDEKQNPNEITYHLCIYSVAN